MTKRNLSKLDKLLDSVNTDISRIEKWKTVNSTVQEFADLHYQLKQRRDALEKMKKRIGSILERIEGEARDKYEKEGIEGARGENATSYLQDLDHYSIADRDKLDKYIKRTCKF